MGYKNKEAQKEYQRNWMARRREELLVNKSCTHCSSTNDLTFCNIKNNGKVFSTSYSKDKLMEKIKDALILCDPCYRLYSRDQAALKATVHGHAGKRSGTYTSWRSMMDRCNNPSKDNYKWYGGRGVTVCERWENFENFLADMGERPSNMTLDRKDPYGNYEPDNCRWATTAEQGANKRKKILTVLWINEIIR